uniref:DUF domain-containing protein n=1 Tax=Streptococcus anginosus TaxID=1328 RepID=UPI002ED9CB39
TANYKKNGEMLHERFGNIYWLPCATHCMNLILKDIGSMYYVSDLAKKSSKVIIIIFNNVFILSWLRKR